MLDTISSVSRTEIRSVPRVVVEEQSMPVRSLGFVTVFSCDENADGLILGLS